MSDPAATIASPAARQLSPDMPGKGRSVQIFQPRNLASWVFLWGLAFGAVAAFRWFQPVSIAVGTATMWASVLFFLYLLPWLWFLRHKDRRTPIPAKVLIVGFLWGGLTAAFLIALPGNDSLMSIYGKAVSPEFAHDWGAALAAPFTEETGKGLGILLLMFIAPRIIRLPFDGFIVGAFVGLGFQIFEDVLYAANEAISGFGADQVHAVMQTLMLRGATGILSHALYSAVYGAGLVYLIGTAVIPVHRIRGIGYILAAMLMHGAWDAGSAIAGEIGVAPLAVMAGIGLIELVVILLIGRRVSRGERAWLREILTPEVDRGTITQAELDALVGSGRERRRFIRSAHGYRDRRMARHVLEAASDLAEALGASDGHDSPEARFARSEVERVRCGAAAG